MGNFGIIVSSEGKDVKTCTDIETLMTSKYPLFKGSTIVTGSVILVNADSEIVTISHNFGYIPFYQARCSGLSTTSFINVPGSKYYISSGGLGMYTSSTADANNIYLTIGQRNSDFGPTMGTRTYYYTVFIYRDKALV